MFGLAAALKQECVTKEPSQSTNNMRDRVRLVTQIPEKLRLFDTVDDLPRRTLALSREASLAHFLDFAPFC